jgi:quercetin dioxygenase-like cupin family protein
MIWSKKGRALAAIQKLKDERALLVTFDELNTIPFDECEDIYPDRPDAVTCTRVRSKDSNRISFRVTMKAGEEWHNHYHDCEENLIVFEGSLYNNLSKDEASRMDTMKIKPFERHVIKSVKDSIFYVEFLKRK